jgi:hypothetical protein
MEREVKQCNKIYTNINLVTRYQAVVHYESSVHRVALQLI